MRFDILGKPRAHRSAQTWATGPRSGAEWQTNIAWRTWIARRLISCVLNVRKSWIPHVEALGCRPISREASLRWLRDRVRTGRNVPVSSTGGQCSRDTRKIAKREGHSSAGFCGEQTAAAPIACRDTDRDSKDTKMRAEQSTRRRPYASTSTSRVHSRRPAPQSTWTCLLKW